MSPLVSDPVPEHWLQGWVRPPEVHMNGEARDLRQLSMRIEQLVRESRISSIAWEQTRALCDYLTLRARVMELEAKIDDLEGPHIPDGVEDAPRIGD